MWLMLAEAHHSACSADCHVKKLLRTCQNRVNTVNVQAGSLDLNVRMLLQVLRLVQIKTGMTMRFYMFRIMPVGLFMALTLHFGNTVYLYLTVSFIQMLKVRFLSQHSNMKK